MLFKCTVVLLGICGSLVAGQSTLPTFTWLNEFAPFSTVPLLKITFPDGNDDDFAILRSFNPVPVGANERAEDVDPCIFEGRLLNEPDTLVTLTGCPFTMNFEVQFTSSRLAHNMFKVVNGAVVPQGRLTGKLAVTKSEDYEAYDASRQAKPLNPNGYITTLKGYYDDNFSDKFGDDAKNAVRRILAHTQHIWKWPSITTKLYFNVTDVVYLSGNWVSGENFGKTCKKEVPSFKDTGINTNIFFGVRAANPTSSSLGIATMGGACNPNPDKDSSHCAMMEYEDSDIAFARSLAHELGHNHGVDHDFIEQPKGKNLPRFDSKNNPCTHVHGIMDYDHFGEGDKSLWTTCSVEDFTAFVNKYPNCLPEVDPAKPPTEIGLPGLSDNECDLTEATPVPLNGYHIGKYNGYDTMMLCIDGYCAEFWRKKEPNACRRICGADSCKGAVNVQPCDMTKQLPGFTGSKEVNLNGFKKTLTCTDGMCYPKYGEGYQNACRVICGQDSCENAVIPKPCKLNLPDGETWVCNAKPYFKVRCASQLCDIIAQNDPVQGYTDTCMRICGQQSCDTVKMKTC